MALLSALDGDHGDSTVTVDGATLRWSELVARADLLGTQLGGAHAVALCGSPTLDTVIAIVACVRAGITAVPVPSDAGPVERDHILRDSAAEVMIGSAWPEVNLERVAVPTRGGSVVGPREPRTDSPAMVLYTSGTTGLPKGAMIGRSALAACLDGLADAWSWTSNDHLAHGLPLFHAHGLILGVLGPLRVGATLTHTGRPTPDRYAAAARKGATMFFGVPTVWSRVIADPENARALASARVLVSGSAGLPVHVFDRLRDLTGHEAIERYGATETLITVSTRVDGERRPGWVGWPIAGVETRLRDDYGQPVVHDGETIGGLQVRGATLFDGYLNLPDKTTAAMTDDGWYITGDAAVINDKGMHRIVGRTSIDIIKTGGYKVGAGEVEGVLLAVPGVSDCAVVGVPDDDLGERIVAYVVGEVPDSSLLIDHVAAVLSAHKRPREIRLVDELPRNAMGKVKKAELR